MGEMAIVTKQELMVLINTLKSIDVHGFDSMDKMVGSVTFLTEILARVPQQEEAKTE